jgi:hypothetical protein
MADSLESFGKKIDHLQKELSGDAIPNRMGMAAKKASLAAAAKDLGSDLAFSGFRRRNAKLGARYEPMSGSAVELQLYPKGLWVLANDGRRRLPPGGRVYPRKGRGGKGSKALNTPWGARKSVAASRSKGLGTLADAERDAEREALKEANRGVDIVVRTVFR